MGKTKIEWTAGPDGMPGMTWNPVRGCSRVSPGCQNCYAERMAMRMAGPGRPYEGLVRSTSGGPKWTGKITLAEDVLDAPLHWRKPCRIFVNSMSDLFHEGVPDSYIDEVFARMMLAPRHIFQVLTKRPERMLTYLTSEERPVIRFGGGIAPRPESTPTKILWRAQDRCDNGFRADHYPSGWEMEWPLPNVHLGVSVESQEYTGRLDVLAKVPAAVRFVSAEPLLAAIDFRKWLGSAPSAQWFIVGGESGQGARTCNLAWIRDIVRQCREAGVPVFVKQLGSHPVSTVKADHLGRIAVGSEMGTAEIAPEPWRLWLRDRKGGDLLEWPEDLRVREFPGKGP